MGNTNVFYKVEIDTKDAVQPIIYFRKAKRCKTAKVPTVSTIAS